MLIILATERDIVLIVKSNLEVELGLHVAVFVDVLKLVGTLHGQEVAHKALEVEEAFHQQ